MAISIGTGIAKGGVVYAAGALIGEQQLQLDLGLQLLLV